MLSNMSIKAKLGSVVIALVLPIVGLAYLLVAEKDIAIDFAEKEIWGVKHNAPLRSALQQLAEHRGMTHGLLNGDASLSPKLDAKRAQLAETFAAVNTMVETYGGALSSMQKWTSIEQTWGELSGAAYS